MKIFYEHGTIAILKIFGRVLNEAPFIQFSLKNPWPIPRHEVRYVWLVVLLFWIFTIVMSVL